MVIDGDNLEVRPKPAKIAMISLALVPLIRGLPMTGHDLEIIVGHLVSVMLVARWSLSFLGHSSRFIAAGRNLRRPLWPCVRQELRNIMGYFAIASGFHFGFCVAVHFCVRCLFEWLRCDAKSC
jgi:hypothetical protein